MNRRQLLKTLAVLPVTPVEKLLEPLKPQTIWDVVMAKHQRDLHMTVIRGGSRPVKGMSGTLILYDEPENYDLYAAIERIFQAHEKKFGLNDLFNLNPQETKPPCTPS